MKRIAEKISKTLEIPEDSISNVSRVVAVGKSSVHIEGFCAIEEYSEEKMRLKLKNGSLAVFGENIVIDEITDEYINLSGVFKSVEFM